MKTAVEWLADELCYITDNGRYIIDNTDDVTDVVNQAKEIEKEQIENSYESGIEKGINRYSSEEYNIEYYQTAEQYYNETFKQHNNENRDNPLRQQSQL
jgi:hydroxymethylpyrimidine pyrophosphatase-like HAD family hydrolase